MADIKAACTAAALNTSTGTQDVTISGLGWTPKVAVVFLCKGDTAGTAIDDAVISFGVTDGTSEFAVGVGSENGQPSSDTFRAQVNDAVAHNKLSAAGSLVEVSGVDSGSSEGPISNGWKFNITSAPSNARYLVVLFLGGSDLSWSFGSYSAASTETPGFEVEFGIFGAYGQNSRGEASNAFTSLGFVTNDGATITQRCMNWFSRTGRASAEVSNTLYTDAAAAYVFSSNLQWKTAVSNITSTDFDVSNPGGQIVDYCVFNLAGHDVWLDDIDSPTSTGSDWTVSGPGFEPQAAILVQSMLQSIDSITTTGDAGALGYSVFDGTREHTVTIADEDAEATTDTQSLYDSQFCNLANDAGTQEFDMSSPSFNANGWTVAAADIAAANGTARKWIGVAFGVGAGTGPTTASLTDGAEASDTMSAVATAAATLSDGAQASDTFSAVASAVAGITEAVSAGDSTSKTAALTASLTEGATGDETLDALAQASAALIQGASAGETWIASVAGASQGLITEGSQAAESFVAAAQAYGAITGAASTSDAITGVLRALRDISEAAEAGDAFSASAVGVALLSAGVNADALITASAVTVSQFTAGALAGASFDVAGVVGFIQGAITLQAAIASQVDADPAIDGVTQTTPAVGGENDIN